MLEEIVKRNGETEPYNQSKVNNWIIWASEQLGDRVDWNSVVTETTASMKKRASSQELQKRLIKNCVVRRSWPYSLMAGRLYTAVMRKEIYGDIKPPTISSIHKKMAEKKLIRELKYSEEDYAMIEKFIDHNRDFNYSYPQLIQLRKKYGIKNRKTKEEFETPQFIYMRKAMALAEDEPENERLFHIVNWYNHFSFNRINSPSPNYINLGTYLNGYASCCVFKSDDNIKSLAAGDHIAYMMTAMSAGIGGMISTRTEGDPIRGGAIVHSGKSNYYRALAAATKANQQAGRGGSVTQYYSAFDPEAEIIAQFQNPMTPAANRIREMHFGVEYVRLISKKVALNEDMFVFTEFSAPDLWQAQFSGDSDAFEALYDKYEKNPLFIKKYRSAREFIILARQQAYECGTHYELNIDEMNRHTPFYDPIYSSNLCAEIALPTKGYDCIEDLYSCEDHGRGEIAICALGGLVVCNITNDEQYKSAAYYTLKMIDKCIDMSDYPFPHVAMTARKRRSAGVGMLGVATELARKKIKYSSQEGADYSHFLAERHYYFLLEASLRLAQEKGNAEWMHKTKWPQGWLPIDTYKQSVDELVAPNYVYDWEDLRARVIKQGGIRNSVLCAHMPTESSSKAAGVPNSIYPIRELSIKKSDNSNIIDWVATDSDILADDYELAYNIPTLTMIERYAIFQKFTDQAISADFWENRVDNPIVYTDDIVIEHLAMRKYGMKSRYYQNSLTSDQVVSKKPKTKKPLKLRTPAKGFVPHAPFANNETIAENITKSTQPVEQLETISDNSSYISFESRELVHDSVTVVKEESVVKTAYPKPILKGFDPDAPLGNANAVSDDFELDFELSEGERGCGAGSCTL